MFGVDVMHIIELIGYPGIFAIVYAETGLFFGFFLPGASMLFIAGLLASHGLFNIWILAPLIITAAILGDVTGYWFGRYIGVAIFRWADSRFFHKDHVERTRAFFERYGAVTILLARFLPIVRTFAPILAGVGKMRFGTFLFYNIVGAFLWGGGFVLAGYFLGERVPGIEKYITLIVLGIIAVTSIPVLVEYFRARTAGAPGAVIFDLDNTLARSFTPLSKETASAITTLLQHRPVAIMSGASFERMKNDVVSALTEDSLKNLYLFPDTGASCYQWSGRAWECLYQHVFTPEERDRIVSTLRDGIETTRISEGVPCAGERVVVRESQITFAGLGDQASALEKEAWDPDRKKRDPLQKYLAERLAGFDVRVSSRTAIDITKSGVDKAGAVRWLAQKLGMPTRSMLFVGDDLRPGGNDAIVIPTGVRTRQVSGPEEAPHVIAEILTTIEANSSA